MTVKRKISMVLTAALLMTGLTGCAENQIKDLSEDEIQAVGEYVALTMMKDRKSTRLNSSHIH